MNHWSIADDVVFVTLCFEHEGWIVASNGLPLVPPSLDAAIAGAHLLELTIERCIERRDDRLIAVQRKPHADADLAAVVRKISAERPRTISWWVERLAAGKPHLRTLERLRARRLAGEYEQQTRGIFGKRTVRRVFAPDWGSERWIMDKLHAAWGGERTDDRTEGLLAILCAGGVPRWTGSDSAARRRAWQLTRDHWLAREVAHLVACQSIPAI